MVQNQSCDWFVCICRFPLICRPRIELIGEVKPMQSTYIFFVQRCLLLSKIFVKIFQTYFFFFFNQKPIRSFLLIKRMDETSFHNISDILHFTCLSESFSPYCRILWMNHIGKIWTKVCVVFHIQQMGNMMLYKN